MERGRKVTLLRHFPSGGTQQGPPTTSWPEPSYIATPGRNEGWEISPWMKSGEMDLGSITSSLCLRKHEHFGERAVWK